MAGVEHPTLVAAALVAAGAGAVYVRLGSRLGRRPASDATRRLALRMFALWWGATGVNILLATGFIAAAAFGWTDVRLQVAYAVLQRLLLAASLVGLMHYLLVLVRGRAPVNALVALYTAFFLVQLGTIFASDPDGVYVGAWRTDLAYAHEDAVPDWLTAVLGAWLVLPPVVLSVTAIVVARHLGPEQHTQRMRITLVGSALVAWWVTAVLAGQREAFGIEGFQVFNRLLGLTMALVILVAYEPPAWLAPYVQGPPTGPAPRDAKP